MKVSLPLAVGAGGLPETLAFKSIDDFHPDSLVSRVEAFNDAFDDQEKAELLGKILHDPAFQALEAAWRGLDWLLASAAGQKGVEFKIVDLSAEELRTDLSSAESLEATGLYQILVDQPSQRGELDPWTLLVGLYSFGPSPEDAALLGKLARIARQASAPVPGRAADPAVHAPKYAPEEDAAEAWDALRALPEASLLGLAAPRFLLRPPYGENTRTIDPFEYEESTNRVGWPHYLWGNPALAVANALLRSFGKEGWGMRAGSVLDLTGMAIHVVKDEDDDPLSVLAEAWLTKPVTEALVGLGLIPLLSVRGRDQVSFFGLHSLARPPKGERTSPLLGRWGQKGSVTLPRSGDPSAPAAAQAVGTPEPALANAEDAIDPELAALLADLDGPAAAEPAAAAPEDAIDPELAALLAELDAPAAAEPAAPAPEPEVDPELAALLAELDAPSGGEDAAGDEEPEMDPELAALMAGLDTPAAPDANESPAEEELDPELAAMMAELDASTPAEAEPAEEEELDPELAAMMAELDASTPAEGEGDADAGEVDPELAALLAELDEKPPPE